MTNSVPTVHCSPMRKKYLFRLGVRILVVVAVFLLFFLWPESFSVLEPSSFLREPSPLHLLWLLWMGDMVLELIPVRKYEAMGTQKQFARFAVPTNTPVSQQELRQFVRQSNRSALSVFLVWGGVSVVLGLLHRGGILSQGVLFLLGTVFYACDLICVLFWCPFQTFLMKNRCCTTCRIFNWAHLMMFSTFIFISGFFARSLFVCAVVVFAVWEIRFHRHPARFWDRTNAALRCKGCTDQLCYHCPGRK